MWNTTARKPPLCDGLLPTHIYETVGALPGGTVIADLVSGTDHRPIVPAEFSYETVGNIVHIHIPKVDRYQGVAVEVE